MALSNLRTGITIRQERITASPNVLSTTLPVVIAGLNRDLKFQEVADIFDWSAGTPANGTEFPGYTSGTIEAGVANPDLAPRFFVRNSLGIAEITSSVTTNNVGQEDQGTPTFDIPSGLSAQFTIATGTAGAFTADATTEDDSVFSDLSADFVFSQVNVGDYILVSDVREYEVTGITEDTALTVRRVGKGPESAGALEAAKLRLSPENTDDLRTITATSQGFIDAGGFGPNGTRVKGGDLLRVDNWQIKESSGGLVYTTEGELEGTILNLTVDYIVTASDRVITYPDGSGVAGSVEAFNNASGAGTVIFLANDDDDLVPAMYLVSEADADRNAASRAFAQTPLVPAADSDFGDRYRSLTYTAAAGPDLTGAFSAEDESGQRTFTDISGNFTVGNVPGGGVQTHILVKGADGIFRPTFNVISRDGNDNTATVEQFSATELPSGAYARNVEFILVTVDTGQASVYENKGGSEVTETFATDPDRAEFVAYSSGNYGGYSLAADDRLLISDDAGVQATFTITMDVTANDLAAGDTVVISDGTTSVSFIAGTDFVVAAGNSLTTLDSLGAAIDASALTITSAAATGTPPGVGSMVLTFDTAGAPGNDATVDVTVDTNTVFTVPLLAAGPTNFTGGEGNDFSLSSVAAGDYIFSDTGTLMFRVQAVPTAGTVNQLVVTAAANIGTQLAASDILLNFGFNIRTDGLRSDFVVRRVISDSELEVAASPTSPNSIPGTQAVNGMIYFQDTGDTRPVSVTVGDSAAAIPYEIEKTVTGGDLTGDVLVTYAVIRDDLTGVQEVSASDYASVLGDDVPDNPLGLAARIYFANSSTNLFVIQVKADTTEGWQAAIEAAKTDAVYSVVPLTNEETYLALWRAHVIEQSLPDNKRERILWQSHRFLEDQVRASLEAGDNPLVSRSASGIQTVVIERDLIAAGAAIGDDFTGVWYNGTTSVSFDGRITNLSLAGSTTTITMLPDGNVPNGTTSMVLTSYQITERPLSIAELRDEVVAYAGTIAERRIRNVYPDQVVIQFSDDTGNGESTGFYGGGVQLSTEGGQYMCVVEAAKRTAFGPAKPLTKRGGAGIYQVLDTFAEAPGSQDPIIDAGNYYMEQPGGLGGSVQTLRALTTDVSELITAEESVTPQIDSFVRRLRAQLTPLLGPEILDQRFFDLISAVAQSAVTRTLNDKELKSIKLLEITESPDTPDTFLMKYEVVPFFSGARGIVTIFF